MYKCMERLTINRLGQVRNKSGISKEGKPYNFNSIGFQTNEHVDRWYDFSFNGDSHRLEVGKQYDFEVKEREYNGKMYYSASFPKRFGGGLSETDKAALAQASREAYSARVAIQILTQRLEDAGVIQRPGSVVPGTTVKYPEEEPGNPFPDESDGFPSDPALP